MALTLCDRGVWRTGRVSVLLGQFRLISGQRHSPATPSQIIFNVCQTITAKEPVDFRELYVSSLKNHQRLARDHKLTQE